MQNEDCRNQITDELILIDLIFLNLKIISSSYVINPLKNYSY